MTRNYEGLKMTLRILLISLLCAVSTLFAGCEADSVSEALITEAELQAQLDNLQEQRPEVPGFAIAIVRQDEVMITAATGISDSQGRALTPDTPARIASNTKTFVAAAVLRLMEQGRIELDTSIDAYISPQYTQMLIADGYDISSITVRHVLMHASGLNDHFGSDVFENMVFSNPTRVWTRTDQLQLMVDITDPLGAPGAAFAYSDSGYVLLGDMIEQITAAPLGKAIRELTRFDQIGLENTWWDEVETPPVGAQERAHQWLGETDTYAIHGSADAHGGGGLIASVEELARFYAALLNGDVFDNPSTLALMTEAQANAEGRIPIQLSLPRHDTVATCSEELQTALSSHNL